MKILEISENDSGQRLDKFLKKLFPQATRSLLYKLNRTSKIKISEDGISFKKQDNEYKLKKGEKVKIFLSDSDFKELSKSDTIHQKKSIGNPFNKEDIVYEDSFLLVVNKSPGVTVHPGDHKSDQSSLIEQVQDYLGNKIDSLTFKPSLVHRIDRDTSGIVLIAKKKDILSKLVDDLKEHTKIKKIYYAIVLGKLIETSGSIDAKLERLEDAKNQNKVTVSKDGQKALTHYKLIEEKSFEIDGKKHNISCLEVEIETGRMHQIRVHLAHIGHPIIGDDTYGDKGLNYLFRKHYGVTRQLLHAWKIEFFHYGRGKNINLEAKLKRDMSNFIGGMKTEIIGTKKIKQDKEKNAHTKHVRNEVDNKKNSLEMEKIGHEKPSFVPKKKVDFNDRKSTKKTRFVSKKGDNTKENKLLSRRSGEKQVRNENRSLSRNTSSTPGDKTPKNSFSSKTRKK